MSFLKWLLDGQNETNPSPKAETPPIDLSIKFGRDTDGQVSELLKKATALKKTNIEQAIEFIKQAIEIQPDYPYNERSFFKLKSYLLIANKTDEAEQLLIHLLKKCRGIKKLDNFSYRSGIYDNYADLSFRAGRFSDYIYYYCSSIYNSLVWEAIMEQKECIDEQLRVLKAKEEFIDRKTNKSFQELRVASNQSLFIETFCNILLSFDFDSLYYLVNKLNNQGNKEDIEIEGIKKGKEDWLLWSSVDFQNKILSYDELIFLKEYRNQLDVLILPKH